MWPKPSYSFSDSILQPNLRPTNDKRTKSKILEEYQKGKTLFNNYPFGCLDFFVLFVTASRD